MPRPYNLREPDQALLDALQRHRTATARLLDRCLMAGRPWREEHLLARLMETTNALTYRVGEFIREDRAR